MRNPLAEPAIAAVIGDPVKHSLSPEIFDFLARRLGVPLVYRKIRVMEGDLARLVWTLRELPMLGCNVTIPHKESILGLLDRISPEAAVIGAVNVVENRGGELVGHNTDARGVIETLAEHRVRVRGAEAWVLGAGGAARAVCHALGTLGARRVWVENRTSSRARALCRDLGRVFQATEFSLVRDAVPGVNLQVCINTTPLGMTGVEGEVCFPMDVRRGAWAFDVVYRPENTPFLARARRQGLRTIGGLDMLIWQALATWEIWIGRIPRRGAVKTELKRRLRRFL